MYDYMRGTHCDNVRDRRACWVCAVRYLWNLLYIKVKTYKYKGHVIKWHKPWWYISNMPYPHYQALTINKAKALINKHNAK